MMTPWTAIKQLESNSSRKFKEELLAAEARSGNTELFTGARYALDALTSFGVKKVSAKTGAEGPGLDWATFQITADKLAVRDITGNAARNAIDALMAQATTDQWNHWFRRVLLKDLKCGATEKTFNTAAEAASRTEYLIPVFTCQLAKDCAEDQDRLTGKRQIDDKMDGQRVLTIVYPSGAVEQRSRNGQLIENFPTICEQFAKVAHTLAEPTVFDGEIMSASFQDLMKQARRKSNVQTTDCVMYLFDIVPYDKFLAGYYEVPQSKRSELLKTWFEQQAGLDNVALLGNETVDLDTVAGQARYREINAQAIALKREGIMLKDPTAPYECKRSENWLKLKPVITVDLTVIAIEEGTVGSKHQGKMGALLCEGIDQGKLITVSVGGGFSDQQRAQIWADYTGKACSWEKKVQGAKKVIIEKPRKGNVIGQVAEVLADVITQNQDGTYSLRFPRFKTWRGFKTGEKR